MSLPYFPMFPSDFEAKTSHLTLEEDGAYNRLLRLCWMTPGCSLPDDPAWIARRMRVDAETFQRVVLPILDEFFTREKGRVFQKKLSAIFDETSEKHLKRVDAGKKGGRPRKPLESKQKTESNAKAMPKQPEPEPEPEPKATSVAVRANAPQTAAPPGVNSDDRVALLAAIGVGPDGVSGPSSFIGTMGDMAEAQGWSSLGLSLPEQCQIIREACDRQRAKQANWMPRRFGYFTGLMQDFAAKRGQAASGQGRTAQDIDAKIGKWKKMAGQA